MILNTTDVYYVVHVCSLLLCWPIVITVVILKWGGRRETRKESQSRIGPGATWPGCGQKQKSINLVQYSSKSTKSKTGLNFKLPLPQRCN